jgi:hypothetical protein
MEPIFENTTVRTEAIDREFYANVRNSRATATEAVILSGLFCFGVYELYKGVIGAPGGYSAAVTCFVCCVLFALFLLWQNRTMAARERRRTEKRYGTAELENHTQFFAYEYRLCCEKSRVDVTIRYSDIARILHTEHTILLIRQNGTATILSRDGFTPGGAEAFTAFLAEKCPAARVRDKRSRTASGAPEG